MAPPTRNDNPSQWVTHTSPRYADKIKVCQFRRGSHDPVWDAKYLIGGKWSSPHRLGTRDPNDAMAMSIGEYTRRTAGVMPAKRIASAPTFRDAASHVLERLTKLRTQARETYGFRTAQRYTVPINRIKQLDTQFGLWPIAEITRLEIRDWLNAFDPLPASSSVGNLNHAWGKVMQEAVERGWITDGSQLKISKKGFAVGSQRPCFTSEDMGLLARYMSDDWADTEIRKLIRAYIAVGATTGIRAGLELEHLHVRQIMHHPRVGKTAPYYSILVIRQKVKGSQPRLVSVYGNDAFDMQAMMGWLTDGRDPDEKLFARRVGRGGRWVGIVPTFLSLVPEVFASAGVGTDRPTGQKRTAYSLRHWFATAAILRGVDPFEVSKLMGTSVAMIEAHYAHAIAERRLAITSGASDPVGALAAALRRLPIDEFASVDEVE